MKFFRFSISTALLLVAVAALGIALAQARLRVARLEAELQSLTPLRAIDIAAQVEAAAASVGVPATVQSLAYNNNGPTYLISYAYHDPDTGAGRMSTFLLTYEGDGKYSGHMRAEPYLSDKPDKKGERGLPIVVWDKRITSVLNAGR